MADPFVSEIRIFGFNFAPVGWATCSGQVLPIQQYTALFSLIGTYFGGNGTSNFQLPNFQGNVPLSMGQGPGLSDYALGEIGGSAGVTLQTPTAPTHSHGVNADKGLADMTSPAGNLYKEGLRPNPNEAIAPYNTSFQTTTNLNPQTITPAGGSAGGGAVPHNNVMPIMALNFCICLQGVFPPRS